MVNAIWMNGANNPTELIRRYVIIVHVIQHISFIVDVIIVVVVILAFVVVVVILVVAVALVINHGSGELNLNRIPSRNEMPKINRFFVLI